MSFRDVEEFLLAISSCYGAMLLAHLLPRGRVMRFSIRILREDVGRWIAEVPALPGVMVYGSSSELAIAKVKALALRVIADRLEQGEADPDLDGVTFAAA
jgi:predicted RNase H-like HicB family nuclease